MKKRKIFLFAIMVLLLATLLTATPLFAGTAQLTWNKPALNANGQPLTELTGYRIYFGTAARTGTMPPGGYNGAGSPITITNPDQLTYTFNNLEDGHTWYFSVTAFNTGGESDFSNEGSKLLCGASVASALSANFGPGGGIGDVTVTAQSGCAWTAASNTPWITITSGASGSGNGTVAYAVAANAGPLRTGTMTIAGQTFTVTQGTTLTNAKIGVFTQGSWYLDADGSGAWSGTNFDTMHADFGKGLPNAIPVVGDWDNTGIMRIGVYSNGTWYFDMNNNGQWDAGDRMYADFGKGLDGAIPVVGDWDNTGRVRIGIFWNGNWYLDKSGDGAWSGAAVDIHCPDFGKGLPNAIPVVGDWDNTGLTRIGIYSDGTWYFDMNGSGQWEGPPGDRVYADFGKGLAGAIPVVGDWDGTGLTRIGVYWNGSWYLDKNGDGAWSGTSADIYAPDFGKGLAGARPVIVR